ncbi:MAG: DUF1669 domain-containing protein [bacterium]|nr:DUF1669 domain-containing protein [bacterium]
MTEKKRDIKELTAIFEKTFEDGSFSRSEKKAVAELLEKDFKLSKDTRDFLRKTIFDIARKGMQGHSGLKIVEWLETANKLLLNRQDSAAYFSPGAECRLAIVEQLEKAVKMADICVFTISDDRITRAITDCMGRGVRVRIITDNEKCGDRGSDVYTLERNGAEVRIDRSSHHMHHKFAVFDKQRVLTGSYNWTRSAAEYNQENILLTDDKKVVAAYDEEFDLLWECFG